MASDRHGAESNAFWAWMLDVGLAAVAVSIAVSLAGEALGIPAYSSVSPVVAYTLASIHGGVLLGRRRYPEAVHSIVIVSALAFVLLGLPYYFLGIAILVSTNTVAVLCTKRRSLAWLAVAELALVLATLASGSNWDTLLFYAGLVAGSWLLGSGNRRLRIYAREERRRADELERARHELARLAVTRERLHIARELHDVLAHGMTMIAVQAGTGRMVIDRDPVAARASLEAIEVTARRAVTEMRHLLDALRKDDDTPSSLSPAPGIEDLHSLVAEFARSGLMVELRIGGEPRAAPPGPALAAYRIIQEALTNVLKHAGQVRTSVALDIEDAELRIQVANEAPLQPLGAEAQCGGQGSIGMSERASLYGGRCEMGPTPTGGWVVHAVVPVRSIAPWGTS